MSVTCSRASANAHLDLHKLASALVADLEEGLTRHVLNTGVGLVHKLKELVHDSLQKLPVVAQEPGILAHHIPEAARIFIKDTGNTSNKPPTPSTTTVDYTSQTWLLIAG